MRLKWVFGAVITWAIPAILVGGLVGALAGGRPTLIEFEDLVAQGEITQEEFDNLSEMQKFMLQTRPGYPGSGRFWLAFFVGFAATEALGLAWLKRRERDSEPDEFGRLVWEILGNRRRRRQSQRKRSPDT